MTDLTLTIERYAEMRADMDAGKLRDEVLAISGLSVDAWTTQQSSWLAKMGAELEGGRFELTNRYSRAFLDRQQEIRKRAAPPPVVKPVAPIAPVVEAPAIAAPVAPPKPAPIAPQEPGFASVPMSRGQLFVSDAPSPWAGAPEPKAATPKQELASTSFFSAESFVSPALPFQPGSSASDSVPPPPVPQAAPAARKKVDRSTQAISVVSLEDILPFEPTNPAHPPIPTQPLPQSPAAAHPVIPTQPLPQTQSQPPPAVVPAPPPVRKRADSVLPPLDHDPLASTMGFDNAINLGPALPFGANSAAKTQPEPVRSSVIPPAPQPVKNESSFPPLPPPQPVHQIPIPGKRASESVFPQVVAPPAQAPAQVPAQAQALAPLTLEQYASLCVEMNANPNQAAEIAGRYGLTQPQWTHVNAYWQARMARESDVRAAWERACVTYRQWLMGR